MVAFFSGEQSRVRVESDAGSIVLTVDGSSCTLSRADASELQEAVAAAMTERREYFRTAGEHREDGSYVVSRRGADSSGNAKVFESFEHLRRLYDRLPGTFDAEDVGTTGITGSRRHMLVRHFAEHPAFDCTIASRNPLAVEKAPDDEATTVTTENDIATGDDVATGAPDDTVESTAD